MTSALNPQTSDSDTNVKPALEDVITRFACDARDSGTYLSRTPKSAIAAAALFFPFAILGDSLGLSSTSTLFAVMLCMAAAPYLIGLLLTVIYRQLPFGRIGCTIFRTAAFAVFVGLLAAAVKCGTIIVVALDSVIVRLF